jgi:voltage-gated potassium channel
MTFVKPHDTVKFFYLFYGLLFFTVFSPLLFEFTYVKFFIDALMACLLFLALLTLRPSPIAMRIGAFLLFMLLALSAIALEYSSLVLHASSAIILLGFFSYIIYGIGCFIITTQKVNTNIVYAALCVYLFIGVGWGQGYLFLELMQSGSFGGLEALSDAGNLDAQIHSFTYLSFVTLTTLGYGELVPLTPLARSLCFVEAIVGQFYIATFVARLVAMQIQYGDRCDHPSQ